MNTLNLHRKYTNQATAISNIFIDQYMPQANGEFIKVYIYLLRCLSDNEMTVSVSALADTFNQTETDVIRALKYWAKCGVLNLTMDNTSGTVTDVTFCDLNSDTHDNNKITVSDMATAPETTPASDNSVSGTVPDIMLNPDSNNNKVTFNIDTIDTGAAYSPALLTSLAENEDFKMLIFALGTYLGGRLSQPETSTIAYLYDRLGFKSDLIEFLVEYCVTRGHKSMRYIEKTALAWADLGVTSVASAKEVAIAYTDTVFAVLKAFGITNRTAGSIELDYIKKWTDVYDFSNDIIIEACNRTLNKIHEPSFSYADSILTKWNKANVKSFGDIKKLDLAHDLETNSAGKTNTSRTAQAVRPNKFNNFPQRNIDIDSLESMLISNK